LAWAGVALLVVSCNGAEPDLPAVEIGRSAHFHYYARAADRVPASVLDLLEANWTEMSTFFGLDQSLLVKYYLFDSRDDFVANGPCPSFDGACAWGRAVYSERPFHEHELIHSYFAPLGPAPSIVEEGVASGLSCFEFLPEQPLPPSDPSWQAAVRNDHVDSTDYGQSRFVRQLIREHGPERFRDFYESTEATRDPAVFSQQFDRFWGESIDVVWAEATASSPSPTYRDLAMCPCSAAPLPVDGSASAITALFGALSLPRPFTLATETDVAVSLQDLGGSAIRNCWDQDYQRAVLRPDSPAPPAVVFLHLPAGHYFLQARPLGAAPASVSLTPGAWLAADCAAGEVFPVGANFAGSVEILGTASVSYLHLDVPGPREAMVSANVSVCPACDSPASECTTGAAQASTPVTLNGAYVVKVTAGQWGSVAFQ
jgi:hypothetical protein